MVTNSRLRTLIALATFSLVGTTACSPAMPPELSAQLADSTINCGSADVTVAGPVDLGYVVSQWGSDYNSFCPNATVSVLDQTSEANIVFTDNATAPTSCSEFLSAPISIEAAVIATNVQGTSGIVVDANVLSKIIQGEITSWADPAIAGINPVFELPDEPILVSKTVNKEDADAINAWMTNVDAQNWKGIPSDFMITDSVDAEATISHMANEGSIAFLPSSFALNNGYQLMAFAATADAESVMPSIETVYSASTQLDAETTSSSITAAIDYTKAPLPAPGEVDAAQPWQAIYPIYEHLCSGGNEQDVRAFARFSLRIDSQGYLLNYNLQPITDEFRGRALELVSQGLPSPSPIEPDTAATP